MDVETSTSGYFKNIFIFQSLISSLWRECFGLFLRDYVNTIYQKYFTRKFWVCVTEDLLITRNEFLVIIIILSFFSLFLFRRFLRDASMDFLEIFRYDGEWKYPQKFFLFFQNSLPVVKYGRFTFFKKPSCPPFSSETVKDREMKLTPKIDLSM